jgi:purine-nucleoside phosphorylase
VEGHVNEIVVGTIGKQAVVMLRGRAHTYETGDCTGMAGALRTLARWGVKVLVQTNASGSLRTHNPPGSLMLINDHINAPQRSPLVGEQGSERFVDMSAAYDAELRSHAMNVAKARNMVLSEGTYVWALGPRFACSRPGAPMRSA